MDKSDEKLGSVKLDDIGRMATASGTLHRFNSANKHLNVMEGEFKYSYNFSGVSVHSSRVFERQTMSSSLELNPGLSFNILLEGEINFDIGDTKHHLGHHYKNDVECSAYVLNHAEMFTRYLNAGRSIAKVNVSVDKSWLEARCTSREDHRYLAEVFSNHGALSFWKADERVIELASSLIFDRKNGLLGMMELESKAIELINHSLDVLHKTIKISAVEFEEGSSFDFKTAIDSCLSSCQSLDEIATKLKISVSTLQRKFKQKYDMTVIEYVRLKRLDMARSAIKLQGLSIGEAAYVAGYNHTSNFVTAFKKQFYLTPAEFMKKCNVKM